MSGTTIISPSVTDTTLIQDNQAPGSITPGDIRQMNDSLSGMPQGAVRTTSQTLALGDRGTVIPMNSATAVNLTIPINATTAFQVGTVVGCFNQGAGLVTVVASAGVTPITSASLVARAQGAMVFMWKFATDTWVVYGDLA